MNKIAIIMLVRQVLVVAGAILVGTSIVSADQVETAAGAIAAIIGVCWEVYERRHALAPKPKVVE